MQHTLDIELFLVCKMSMALLRLLSKSRRRGVDSLRRALARARQADAPKPNRAQAPQSKLEQAVLAKALKPT